MPNNRTLHIFVFLIVVIGACGLGLAVFLSESEGAVTGPEMVLIEPGSFEIKIRQQSAALPGQAQFKKQVSLPRPFEITRREVSFAEYDACVAAGGCRHRPDDRGKGRGDRPVTDVSWFDAVEYAQWLSRETGRNFRLPTEEEWEFALHHQSAGSPAISGARGPVWEWTLSCWSRSEQVFRNSPASETLNDPDHCYVRILRGETRTHSSDFVRRAYGGGCNPEQAPDYFGFRLVKEI